MEVRIDLVRDSENSHPTATLVVRDIGGGRMRISVSDGGRVVDVERHELLRAIRALTDALA